MPAHPPEACYCHIIEAGLKSIEGHRSSGNTDQLAVELEHVLAVTQLLTSVLL